MNNNEYLQNFFEIFYKHITNEKNKFLEKIDDIYFGV